MSRHSSKSIKNSRFHWRLLCVSTLLLLIMLHLALAGCSTWQVPKPFDEAKLRGRAVTKEVKGVRMSAAVLSTEDSLQMFGVDVNGTGVQPVWIEVENNTQQMLWLLRSGTDPDLFSPLEVAWSFHATFSGSTNARLDDHFNALQFQNPIAAGTKQSGILYTNPHRQTRFLNVDLLGLGQMFPFTLFPAVPDDIPDEQASSMLNRLAEEATVNYQELETLRARLEQLPCCAMSEDREKQGDPVNMVLIGRFEDIAAAVVRRGFRRAELKFDNAQYYFDRQPDTVVRKAGQGGVPANWLRVWLAPFRYQNQSVFLVQAGRPIGGRFKASQSKDLILHPNVDEVRNLLIQDMLYSGGLGKLAFISGVGVAAPDEPRISLNDTHYYTDGLRAVLFFETRPLALSDVEILDWVPYLKNLESHAVKAKENARR
ncbi:hypothetical protein [Kaarinaea lacus]